MPEKIYLLWISEGTRNYVAAIYSTKENAESEVEIGELYCIQESELDRDVTMPLRGWTRKVD